MSEAKPLPIGATVYADGSVGYILQYPIKYKVGAEDRSVNEVTVRRKRLDDNLAIKKLETNADVAFVLIQRLCDLDANTAKLVDDVDNEAIAEIIESFTTPGRTTGSDVSA